ncbi:MAG TPA: hypothetical protein VK837_01540 [Longimicrobiales bacterium]|nr:hypothetical protein [Longimicrobiales bacterium]
MPEAFPEFDQKPPEPAPADPDGTEEPPPQVGPEVDPGPDPWKSADAFVDPYVDPYHAGPTGSGSGHAAPGPTATEGLDADHAPDAGGTGELDGTGLAGLMRRWGAGGPAQAGPRRVALDLADHVEAVETRVGGVLGRPLRDRGLDGLAGRVERNPLATIAGALLAGWLVNRMFD